MPSASRGVSASSLTVSDVRDSAAWDAFIAMRPDATGYHSYGWRQVFEEAFGHRTTYLGAHRDGVLAGVLPLVLFESRLFGRFAVSLPFVNYGGLLAADDAAAAVLLNASRELATSQRLSHVELRHCDRRLPALPCKEHKVTMLLPLKDSAEAMWEALDRKVRNQTRKAEKSDLGCVVGGSELLSEFYPVFATNMRDLGTPVYARRFFDGVFREFPDRASVFAVRKGAQTIAAGIGWRTNDRFEVPWASSLREFRNLSPNNLLYWEAIKHAIARGCRVFDFGRSTPNEGTYHFKRQWGAEPHPLFWEYQLIGTAALPDQSPKNPKFALAIAAWKRLPVALTRIIGPHLVRSIP